MKKQPTWAKVLIALGVVAGAIAIVALGTKIGNIGLKDTMQEWKDEIRDQLDNDKNNTSTPSTSTSAQAYLGDFVEFVD